MPSYNRKIGQSPLQYDDYRIIKALEKISFSGSIIPDQTGQAGKFLTTNGSSLSWAAGGGGGNTIYTGDGTLAGNRTVDQNGNTLTFTNEASSFIVSDGTNATSLTINSATQAITLIAGNGEIITLDDGPQTINYTAANGHIFTGNVGIGVTPTADQLFVVNDGSNNLLTIDKTNFESTLDANDGTARSRLRVQGNLAGNNVKFLLESDDGTNNVSIEGDAIAQTITLTAANGFIVNGATGATDDVVIVGLTNTYTLHFSSGLYTGTTIT